MQNEITTPQPLFDAKGHLTNPGWARHPYFQYDRKDVKASKLRLKEWDYYYVSDGRYALCLTIADLAYLGLVTATLIDLDDRTEQTVTDMPLLPMGKLHLPPSSEKGDVRFSGGKLTLEFLRSEAGRKLKCSVPKLPDGKALSAEVTLTETTGDTMVIATPWAEKPLAFYYNQKINCQRASGLLNIGGEKHFFQPENSFATLDWGRGVWTYDNTWYWGTANGLAPDGELIGFNIGYGFGDTSRASENLFYYGGAAHKLDRIAFEIPEGEYCNPAKPWRFTSNDGRLEMTMTPVYDRRAYTSLGPILNDGHQVFGTYAGTAILDDGRAIRFENVPGFAEQIHNKY